MPTVRRVLRPLPILFFGLVAAVLAGCYVVPAPPPLAGIGPLPPPYVQATPQCRWDYGWGWYGWGWYSVGC
jgi:hypothetical protein